MTIQPTVRAAPDPLAVEPGPVARTSVWSLIRLTSLPLVPNDDPDAPSGGARTHPPFGVSPARRRSRVVCPRLVSGGPPRTGGTFTETHPSGVRYGCERGGTMDSERLTPQETEHEGVTRR